MIHTYTLLYLQVHSDDKYAMKVQLNELPHTRTRLIKSPIKM